MSRKLLQALLAIATFTVVWLVASPAEAATPRAPVCDPRGATGFAPPPQIQDAELSLDIPADCADVNPLETKNVVPGRGPAPDFSSSQEPASANLSPVLHLSFVERLPPSLGVEARPPSGVRASIDRPPQR